MNIGRNDPCPCGSGKKYKKCCLEKTVLKTISIPVINNDLESLVIIPIITDPNFKKIYENERNKINFPILWLQNNLLSYNATYDRNPARITLKRIPPKLNDAITVAHELSHAILDAEKYPYVGTQDRKYSSIIAPLNSLFQDILIDKKLYTYGFDIKEKYKLEIEDYFSKIKNAASPQLKRDQIFWILNYTSILLDYEWLKKEEVLTENKFISWFEEQYPDITEESHTLHKLINEIGFDTPEKMTSAYNMIIQRYNLGDSIQIHALS